MSPFLLYAIVLEAWSKIDMLQAAKFRPESIRIFEKIKDPYYIDKAKDNRKWRWAKKPSLKYAFML